MRRIQFFNRESGTGCGRTLTTVFTLLVAPFSSYALDLQIVIKANALINASTTRNFQQELTCGSCGRHAAHSVVMRIQWHHLRGRGGSSSKFACPLWGWLHRPPPPVSDRPPCNLWASPGPRHGNTAPCHH